MIAADWSISLLYWTVLQYQHCFSLIVNVRIEQNVLLPLAMVTMGLTSSLQVTALFGLLATGKMADITLSFTTVRNCFLAFKTWRLMFSQLYHTRPPATCGWQLCAQSCLMPRMPTHLVQEINVGTVYISLRCFPLLCILRIIWRGLTPQFP